MTAVAIQGRYEVPVVLSGCGRPVVTGRTGSEHLRMIHADRRHPCRRGMAVFTDIGCEYVALVFARRIYSVVTAGTVSDDIRVIEIRRSPCHGRVAVVAVVPTRDMGRMLADGNCPVMTRCTGADDLGVVDHHRRLEKRCAVAVFTDVAGQNVILVLAGCVSSVVTTNTISGNSRMIKRRGYPAVGRVTGIAIIPTRDMGRVLANSNRSVMTRCTGADYLCVVHQVGWREQDGIVAVLAKIAGQDMIDVLANRIRAVVTAEAITREIGMIEVRRYPCHRRVAVVATIAAGNVCRILSSRNSSVVTGHAGTDNLRVVHPVSRSPDHRVMAVFTDVGGYYVIRRFTGSVRSIVTTGAIAGDIGVIECRRNPAGGRMTIIAGIAACQVRRVLADRNSIVVAGLAGTNDLGVIHRHGRLKQRGAVAIFTNVGGQYVIQIFPDRIRSIVTTDAIARDIGVIERCRNPAVGRMTIVASVAARNVRRILAQRDGAVMAGRTGTDYVCVIHPIGRRKKYGVMAILAKIIGQNVIDILANGIRSVVTAEAIAREIGVIDVRGYPGHRYVTIVASIATGDMCRILACRDSSIVTGHAGPDNLGVVHPVGRCPYH